MDVDGSYRGPDNQVHKANGFRFVSTFSLWTPIAPNSHCLTILSASSKNNDIVQSLLGFAKQSPYGILPIWQFQGL